MLRALTWMTLILTASTRPGVSAMAQEPAFDRKEDVIYGRKYGTALTMDVFTPKKNANGAAVIFVVSGGCSSRRTRRSIRPSFRPLLDRGYTVFAVVHGSQPRFTIPEILQDMHRAVRFIRYHAKDYEHRPGPDRHLRRVGRRSPVADAGDRRRQGRPEGQGPGRPGVEPGAGGGLLLPADRLPQLRHAGEGDAPRPPITSRPFQRRLRLPGARQEHHALGADHRRARAAGDRPADLPISDVSPDDPPTLIIHGDADKLVPIQQSELIVEKLKEAGVEAKLVVKKGAVHGWPDLDKDLEKFADWFDKHLGSRSPADEPSRSCRWLLASAVCDAAIGHFDIRIGRVVS